jgi:hypothetical protein
MRVVIFGPRTRLAQAVLAHDWVRGQSPLCVARTPVEAEWIRTGYPAAEILPGWNQTAPPRVEREPMGVLVCAAGVIHPGPACLTADHRAAARDLAILETIAQAQSGDRMHVVFVSSVLALGRSPGRGYYAGWKALMEGAIAKIVERAPSACLSIVYPGRLVERRSVARPMSFLSTPYRHAAEVMIRTARSAAPRRAILGLDARLWLAVRGLVIWRDALVGRPRTEIVRHKMLPNRPVKGDLPC